MTCDGLSRGGIDQRSCGYPPGNNGRCHKDHRASSECRRRLEATILSVHVTYFKAGSQVSVSGHAKALNEFRLSGKKRTSVTSLHGRLFDLSIIITILCSASRVFLPPNVSQEALRSVRPSPSCRFTLSTLCLWIVLGQSYLALLPSPSRDGIPKCTRCIYGRL